MIFTVLYNTYCFIHAKSQRGANIIPRILVYSSASVGKSNPRMKIAFGMRLGRSAPIIQRDIYDIYWPVGTMDRYCFSIGYLLAALVLYMRCGYIERAFPIHTRARTKLGSRRVNRSLLCAREHK